MKKMAIHALIWSTALHVIFAIGTIFYGYFLTKNYQPSFTNIEMLETKVAFGYKIHPVSLVSSIFGVAIIIGILLFLYKQSKKITQ